MVKNSPANTRDAEDMGLGRSPGGGNDNPLQSSCLENPVDRGAWWATVHGVPRVGDDLTHTLSTLHCEVSCTNHSCHLLAISFAPNTVGYIHYLFCFMERIQGLNAQCSGSLSW